MSLNESRGPKLKERWPASFDIMGVSRDAQTREALKKQILEGEAMAAPLQNKFAGQVEYRDMSKPVYAPYQFREFPKTLYHPTEKTNVSVIARKKAETHNQLHPETPQLVPDLIALTVTVNDAAEQEKWEAKGFSEQAPHPYTDSEAEAPTLEDEMRAEEQIELCDRGCGKPRHIGRCKKARE